MSKYEYVYVGWCLTRCRWLYGVVVRPCTDVHGDALGRLDVYACMPSVCVYRGLCVCVCVFMCACMRVVVLACVRVVGDGGARCNVKQVYVCCVA